MSDHYLDPTEASAIKLFSRGISGEVVMLNLLRFRDVADYSEFPELEPEHSLSGREAFQKYIDHTLPYLHDSGGSIFFLGEGGSYFIGPPDETWDLVMLIKQDSLQSFMEFASNEEYLSGLGHRSAALLDSRLLPLVEHENQNITNLPGDSSSK